MNHPYFFTYTPCAAIHHAIHLIPDFYSSMYSHMNYIKITPIKMAATAAAAATTTTTSTTLTVIG